MPKDFFLNTVADFTQTVFMADNSMAVTGTVDGHLIVWNYKISENESQAEERRAIKIIELVSCSISVLTTTDHFLVIGSSDGVIRFYDKRFTVEAWFDNLRAGNIKSISFANLPPKSAVLNMPSKGHSQTLDPAFGDVASASATLLHLG
jgi:WD40 repeat protein